MFSAVLTPILKTPSFICPNLNPIWYKSCCVNRDVKFGIQIGSSWSKMGQIWDFLRSVSVHFGSASQNVLKLILESPIFVQFWTNIPGVYMTTLCRDKTLMNSRSRDLWPFSVTRETVTSQKRVTSSQWWTNDNLIYRHRHISDDIITWPMSHRNKWRHIIDHHSERWRTRMSDLGPKWIRLAKNVTKPGLFQISFHFWKLSEISVKEHSL